MFLLLNISALLWLVLYFIIAFGVIYVALFPLFHFALGLEPSQAIRFAWTAGLWGLFLTLCYNSPQHAPYLHFWTGEMTAIINTLCLILLLGGVLLFLWLRNPEAQS